MNVNQLKSLQRISELVTWFTRKVEIDNELGLFDINRVSEDVIIPLLSAVYGYTNLRNLNEDEESYASIDLGDKVARVAYQVTSQNGSKKIHDTLEKFCNKNYHEEYSRLIVYIITKKQTGYKGTGWDVLTKGKLTFNKKKDIQDYSDLLRDIKRLPLEQILQVEEVLEQHFREVNIGDLKETLRKHLGKQLEREKAARKYIPDIFVEIPRIKDTARYFSHPVLFLGKVLDEVTRLDLNSVNRVLEKLELPRVTFNLTTSSADEFLLEETNSIIANVTAELIALRNQLLPYAHWRSTEVAVETLVSPIVSPTRRHAAERMKYYLGNYTSSVSFKIDNLLESLAVVSAKVLLITARAGQGKTNFVCDFAEKVLTKRSIPCIFFTGRDFNHVLPENIEEYFVRTLLGGDSIGISEGMKLLDKYGKRLNKPIIIIIDGINEHTNIQAFSYHLERFVERLQSYENIKIILTCRTEYFEERFSNFKQSSFQEAIRFIDEPERTWSNIHKKHLLQSYLRFFHIQTSFVTRRAVEVLENDTLLLRMFCEVHGDPLASKDIRLPPIVDIHREKLFRQYLNTKIQGAVLQSNDNARIQVSPGNRLYRLLNHITGLMVEREQYSNIPVSDISDEYLVDLGILLGEDIIVRKDLAGAVDIFGNRTEVVNFTFDEFRDFLLAMHLIDIFKNNRNKFQTILNTISEEKSPVAEGVRAYLFFNAKRPDGGEVLDIISKKEWYSDLFIKLIFSLEEEFVSQEDIVIIRSMFLTSAQVTSWVLRMLIMRWNTFWYPKVNILLLFDLLVDLDDKNFDEFVRPGVTGYGIYGYDRRNSWSVSAISKELCDEIDDEEALEDVEFCHLFEFLIFLFPVYEGTSYTSPAFNAFQKFAVKKPLEAVILLSKYIQIRNTQTQSQVWRMLGTLIKMDAISVEFVEKACLTLLENSRALVTDKGLLREIVRFLETYALQKEVWYHDTIVEQMKPYAAYTYLYIDEVDGEDHDSDG